MLPRANIIWSDRLDSTNKEAARLLTEGRLSDKLSLIAAVEQTAGRGQGDHLWTSAPGENLTFSVVLRNPEFCDASSLSLINDYVCPVITDFLRKEGVENSWIKAPNDIWVGDRKICGILIENFILGGRVTATIIGIGLNLKQKVWPSDLPNPVSLSELTGKNYDPREVLLRLAPEFESFPAGSPL